MTCCNLSCLHASGRRLKTLTLLGLGALVLWTAAAQPAARPIAPAQASAPARLPQPGPEALTNALRQIAALEAEAAALPVAQQKIATALRDAHREYAGLGKRAYAPHVLSGLSLAADGQAVVDIQGTISEGLLARVSKSGGRVLSKQPRFRSMRARVPLSALTALAQSPEVKFIGPADFGIANVGSATSEGDVAHQANVARNTYGATGAGVKVGVISTSTRYLDLVQAAGDLGTVNILPGQSGVGGASDTGEGTAMLAIVHDLAPDAQLYFAAGNVGPDATAANVTALADAGCQIIIDDMSYGADSPFHENTSLSQAFQSVSDRGVLLFSSAANSGSLDRGYSGTWRGDFVSGGSAAASQFYPGGLLHDFGGGNYFNPVTNSLSAAVVLYWTDPWGAATNDYNLYVTDVNGNVIYQSVGAQTGSQDPMESTAGATNGQYIVITRVHGAGRFLHLDTWHGRLGVCTEGSTRGHNASSAANAFSVAAASAMGRTIPFSVTNRAEPFTSDGYRRVYFESDGSATTPGNFSSSGGRVVFKPDITAADATMATTAFPTNSEFSQPFYGTSAAAPHAGAIAALLLSYRPDLTPAQVRAALSASALDIEGEGFDRDSGDGIVMADRAVAWLNPTAAITFPTAGAVVKTQPTITGTATGRGALSTVRVALSRDSDGVWYNFSNGAWDTTTFTFSGDFKAANGTTNWSASLPALPNGNYQVHVQAVDVYNHGSDWQAVDFTVGVPQDNTPPDLTVDSIAPNQVVTNAYLPGLFGTAADSESGIVSVTVYLMRLAGGDFLYWDGANWTQTATALAADYAASTGTWQLNAALPSGSLLPNGNYQVQAAAANGTVPPGTRLTAVSFVVDYHPVYYWTAGTLLDNDSYNNNNSWADPANWSPYGVPSADAIVIIDASAPAWPDNTSLGSVRIYGVNLSGAGLVTAGMFVHKLNVSGGTLSGGAVNIDGNGGVFNWTGGTLVGTYGVLAGAVMNVSGGTAKVLSDNAMLVNQGTITWAGGSPMSASGYSADSVVTNTPGALFALAGDGAVFAQNNGYHAMVFYNAPGARVAKTAGADTLVSICTFNNAGEVRCDIGKLDFNATVNLAPGTGFSGQGTNRIVGGTVSLTGTTTVSNSTFELAGGTLTGAADHSATLTTAGNGRFLWSGGWCNGTLNLSVGSVTEVRSSGPTVLGDGAVLNNQGSLTWFGGSPITADGYSAPSYINNLPGAVFTLAGDGSLFAQANGYWTMVLSNAPGARLTKTLGANSQVSVCTFNNAGEINCSSGKLDLNASLNLANGSRFTGAGSTRVMGGTLVLTGTSTVADTTLELASGEFHGADDQSATWATTGSGKLLWSGAWMYGTVTVAANTDLRIGGSQSAALADGAVLNNLGQIQWLGGAPIMAAGYSAPSYINNAPGALFALASDGTTFGQYNGYHTMVFNNAAGARLSKTTGTNTVFGVCVLNNAGELRCDAGVLDYNTTLNLNDGDTLTGTGTHRVVNGTVLMTGTTTVAGALLELANGNFQGAVDGSATLLTSGAGRVLWSGGGLYNTLTLGTNALAELGGVADKYFSDGTVLENHGTLTWSAGRLIAHGSSGNSFIRNRPGALFTLTSTNGADQFSSYYLGQFENHAGAQLVWNPAGECAWPGWSLVNDGVVTGLGGRLNLGAGGASSGLFTNAPGAELRLNSGNFTANEGTRFRGGGLIRISGATLNASGAVSAAMTGSGAGFFLDGGALNGATFTSLGQFTWNGGMIGGAISNAPGAFFTLAGGSSMALGDGAVVWNAGTAQLTRGPLLIHGYSGDSLWNNLPGAVFGIAADGPAFGLQNGYHWLIFNNSSGARLAKLTGTNSLVDSCLLNNSGELRSEAGNLAINTTVNLNAGSVMTGAGRMELQGGVVTCYGPTTIQGTTLSLSGGTFTGNSNAVLAAASGGLFDWSGGTLAGTVSLAAGGNYQLSGSGVKVLADGAVLNNSGTFKLLSSGNLMASGYNGDATVNNQAGGVIQVSVDTTWARYNGYHTATLNNSGTLALDLAPHLFQMDWDYVQAGPGTLKVALTGAAPGNSYSRLAANSVSLSGALTVALGSGFTPASTNTFDVVTYGSEAGQFATVSYPALAGGQTWTSHYGPNALTLSVVQPNLVSLLSSNGHFQVVSSGPPGGAAVLLSSSDLVTWQPVATNAPFSGSFSFDVQASEAPRAFYRVMMLPAGSP